MSIDYVLPGRGPTRISVFDVGGREVARLAHGVNDSGAHRLEWDLGNAEGRRVSAGLYFVTIRWEGLTASRMTVVMN